MKKQDIRFLSPIAQVGIDSFRAAVVVRLITDRCPDQLKLPFFLWTREAVRDLIERRFGIRLSVWTVGQCWPHDQNQMMRNVRSYLYSRQRKPHVVKKYFEADSVRYAAA